MHLTLEYEPEGLVEKVGDKLNIVERQAEGDLERFKAFIEAEGYATGGWRGSVNEAAAVGTPGVDAAPRRGATVARRGCPARPSPPAWPRPAAGAGAAVAATAAKRSGEGESQAAEESEIGGDVVAVGPTGSTESTLQTGPSVELGAAAADSGPAFDDDPGPIDRLDGDVLAVDEFGTATAGVNGGTIGLPVEPAPAGAGDELDPEGPRGRTLDDPERRI